MEDDDFGFTKREESVLRKVLKNCENQEEGEFNERDKNISDERERGTAGVEGTGCEGNVGDGRSVIPDDSEGVSSHEGDGRNKRNSSANNDDDDGDDDEENTSPETGSQEANKRTCELEPSVNRQTPNIPNVVEYHLKVKSQTKDTTRDERRKENVHNFQNKDTKETKEMRTDCKTPLSSRGDRKNVSKNLSMLSIDNNVFEGSTDLPQVFQVKYLGSHDARGLWGIKHTRQPVDNMVATAKSLPTDTILPLVKLIVSQDGVSFHLLGARKFEVGITKNFPIESISYGVQDLVYTRVFSMIVVRENGKFRRISPFECHAFVCESKHHARQLTYALATAFQIYSQCVKNQAKIKQGTTENVKKRFAIDLRSPEEIETDLTLDSEA